MMMTTKCFCTSRAALVALLVFPTACGSSNTTRMESTVTDSGSSGTGGKATSGTGGKPSSETGGTASSETGGTASSETGGATSAGAGGAGGSGPASGGARNDVDGSTATSVLPVDLGSAADYVILAKAGISTVPTSVVTGNIGVSPAAATSITGFSLIADATKAFSTSKQITGNAYAANYASPTPSKMTTAIGDMEHAFTDAAGRAPGVTELGAGNIGAKTLKAGVYGWGTGLLIPSNLTLSGDKNAVWIFQIAQGLTVNSAVKVLLTGGALATNVFWEVGGKVELGTTSHVEGVILSHTSIALATGASVNGRLLAQTAVTIDGSTVGEP